jgi:hypothetical protein
LPCLNAIKLINLLITKSHHIKGNCEQMKPNELEIPGQSAVNEAKHHWEGQAIPQHNGKFEGEPSTEPVQIGFVLLLLLVQELVANDHLILISIINSVLAEWL